jgi:hypothetical protein
LIAGDVRSQAEEKGYPNTRAALFQVGEPTLALMELTARFGCGAADINERGQVLIFANLAAFDTRSLLWNLADGTWAYVGDDTTNVYPIALNDDGIVLEQARNARGQAVTALCKPGGRWERLGTDDGWVPVDINNSGDVIGWVTIEGLIRPWLRHSTGKIILLPYASDHNTTPAAINNLGQIVGAASADHRSHAMLWDTLF